MTTEDQIRERLAKAHDKLEKAEEEVALWEDLLKIASRNQQKLT